MQALYYMDIRKGGSSEMLERFCESFQPSVKARPFFMKLVEGVLAVGSEIDDIIEQFSSNWKISRMSCVDRNIMRIAVYELLFLHEIPPKVSINEAIDVGKKFGTDESGAFINGILDSIRLALEKSEITLRAGPGADPQENMGQEGG
jgi:transcription antitermination protein NusB